MSILGNGVDIVKNSRIKKAIKNINFLNRIYTKKEIADSKKILNKTNYFAKRFAAKEAFVKSLGTGFRYSLNFNDISVKNRTSGKPVLSITSKVKELIKKKYKINRFKIFLSLSDEDKYSIAFVLIKIIK
jgi:holo-[acyl-carrier protein] synthase